MSCNSASTRCCFAKRSSRRTCPCSTSAGGSGFDAVEIIPFDPDHFPAAKVRRSPRDLGLTINTGYGMPAEYNIISPDPAVRRAGIEFSKRLIDLSNEAGAKVFGGRDLLRMGLPDRQDAVPRTSGNGAWTATGRSPPTRNGTPALILGIEPLNRFESHFINVARDAVAFIQEVGLAEREGPPRHLPHDPRGGRHRPARSRTPAALGYVHACENQRGIPGTGLVPWRRVLPGAQRSATTAASPSSPSTRTWKDRQAVLHLAEAGRLARATGDRRAEVPQGRAPGRVRAGIDGHPGDRHERECLMRDPIERIDRNRSSHFRGAGAEPPLSAFPNCAMRSRER